MKFLKGCLTVIGGLFALLIVLGVVGTMMQSPEERKANEQKAEEIIKQEEAKNQTKEATKKKETAKKKEEIEADSLTGPQKNAVRSAKQYLGFQGFSRAGLIQQLSSDAGDGYKVADATIAVDSLKVDWNQEAVRSAKQYLNMQGFSCNGLIEQLSSSAGDQYTVSQATYGAQQAGACN